MEALLKLLNAAVLVAMLVVMAICMLVIGCSDEKPVRWVKLYGMHSDPRKAPKQKDCGAVAYGVGPIYLELWSEEMGLMHVFLRDVPSSALDSTGHRIGPEQQVGIIVCGLNVSEDWETLP